MMSTVTTAPHIHHAFSSFSVFNIITSPHPPRQHHLALAHIHRDASLQFFYYLFYYILLITSVTLNRHKHYTTTRPRVLFLFLLVTVLFISTVMMLFLIKILLSIHYTNISLWLALVMQQIKSARHD